MNMRYTIILTALTTMLGVAVSCNMKPRKGASDGSMSQTAGTPDASGIINPVLAGDRPDPTVVKIGDTYYASATSNEWSPLFPIFRSDDLVNWELRSEEHTSELQSLMRISYAVFCLKKNTKLIPINI